MELSKYRLGDLIRQFSMKCGIPNLTPYQISAVTKDKQFLEPSNQVGNDTSNYKVVPANFFACNLMHVGRDSVLPVALNESGHDKYVSPAYTVFSVGEGCEVLDHYLFMLLQSAEIDRLFWFHADGSVRDGLSWTDFCDIEITLPPLPVQQKYVAIYKAMVANQQSYERGLDDLKLTMNSVLDKIKHESPMKPIGELLREVDCRNNDGRITDVQGINITKQFMPSIADTNGVNLQNYKIVKKGQFAYSGMQTGRDECIRIALHVQNNPIIISPAYSVFEAKSSSALSLYIMMWFSRGESDRRGWFMSDSSIRTNLDLDRFYEIEIPLPDIEVQKSIVELYTSYITRRSINEKLKTQIKDICPILIKGSIEESIREGENSND